MASGTGWKDVTELSGFSWTCGYCGCEVGGNVGYSKSYPENDKVYICPRCDCPTVFIPCANGFKQIPGGVRGNRVDGLPETVETMFSETRACYQHGLYTASVMCARKLLMHVAVDKGAEPNLSFTDYVEWLYDKHYVPPDGLEWVDEIRKRSNEANHEIVMMDEGDASQLIDFCEMLLRLGYEFPSKVKRK